VDGTLIARTPMASPFTGIQFNPQREGDGEAYMLMDSERRSNGKKQSRKKGK